MAASQLYHSMERRLQEIGLHLNHRYTRRLHSGNYRYRRLPEHWGTQYLKDQYCLELNEDFILSAKSGQKHPNRIKVILLLFVALLLGLFVWRRNS